MVSIQSSVENAYVLSLNSTVNQPNRWIGLNLLMSDGFSWTSQDPMSFTGSWSAGFPQNPSYQQCGSLTSSGTWSQEFCKQNLGFICQAVPDVEISNCGVGTTKPTGVPGCGE